MKKSNNETVKKSVNPSDVKVTKATEKESGDVFFSLCFYGTVTVHGCIYKERKGKDGQEYRIIQLPQAKTTKDGKDEYFDLVYCFITDEVKAEIIKQLEALC